MKLAIVGIFFDGYYDIWEDFLELFSQNWPNCPYDLYIVNNERELEFDKEYSAKVLHAGADAEYSRKVQMAVNEIEADYYLLLLEDFFIGEKLKTTALEQVLRRIEKNNLKYYRMSLAEFTPKKLAGKVLKMNPSMEYTVSCQPSIWRRDFLKNCIGTDNYNAWIFEGVYTKSKVAHTPEFLSGSVMDYCNNLHLYHGALQGKILYSTYEHFTNMGYKLKNHRPVMNRKDRIKHAIKQHIKRICPLVIQKLIKKSGISKSVVERYDNEIEELIVKMGL